MNTSLYFFSSLLLLLLLCLGFPVRAQEVKPADSLYKEIIHMDSVLFGAFNSRDVATFENTFTKDLEFYHDKGGLTDLAYSVQSLKNTAIRNDGLRRELVPGSTEIHPIGSYGAVQIGSHRFCHLENGKQDCGTFKFVHLWKKTPDGWKLTRVISYNH